MAHTSFLSDWTGLSAKMWRQRESERHRPWGFVDPGPLTTGEVRHAAFEMLDGYPTVDRLPPLPGLDVDPDAVSSGDLCPTFEG